MGNDAPITDLLHQLQAGENATTDIYGLFIDAARNIAKARLNKRLSSRIGPSTIAHEALEKCIAHAKKESPLKGRDDFMRMLAKQIKMRLYDANRRERAQKRDVSKDVPVSELKKTVGKFSQPDAKAVAGELAVQVVQCIFKEPDETKRTIALLGTLLGYSPGMIQKMIFPDCDSKAAAGKGSGGKSQPPTQSYIRSVITKSKSRLRRELEQEDEE